MGINGFFSGLVKRLKRPIKSLKAKRKYENDLNYFDGLPKPEIVNNTVLIIRTDDIGDYILFRNMLEFIRKSERFGSSNITLIGNSIWKEIAIKYEASVVDDWIWLDKKKYFSDENYQHEVLKQLRAKGFETIICASVSRNFFLDDYLLRATSAKISIGWDACYSEMFQWQRKISNGYLTERISDEVSEMFEFFRNKKFAERIVGCKIPVNRTFINPLSKEESANKFGLTKPYIVLFPDAAFISKKWPVNNFIELANSNVFSRYSIVICGGKSAIESIETIAKNVNTVVKNLTGKTSLFELIDVLAGAELLVSNDTGAAHIGAASGTKIVIIANGVNWQRFIQYTGEMSNWVKPTYPDFVDEKIEKHSGHYFKKTYNRSEITTISVEKVKKAVEVLLSD